MQDQRLRVRTRSGSKYIVSCINEQFTCEEPEVQVNAHADHNQPITRSYPMAEIYPWPPVEGLRLIMCAQYFEDKHHPDRMPGGGKVTSPVEEVEELPLLPTRVGEEG